MGLAGGSRWRTATAVKGGSDTVKNMLVALDKGDVGGGHVGHLTVGMVAVNMLEAARELHEHARWWGLSTGTAAAGLGYMANTLRQAGIRNTANLYRKAMANPELARALISKMPTAADGNALHNLARVLKRGLIVGPTLVGQSGGSNR